MEKDGPGSASMDRFKHAASPLKRLRNDTYNKMQTELS